MQALSEYLESNGLSLRAFGKLVGVTPAAVHYWRKGDREPSPEMARRISEATGIPLYKIRPDIWPQRGPQ